MAVDTEISQVNYEGNGSTSVGYPIPFPFLDADHILVGTLNEDDEIVLLDAEDYTVDVELSEVRTDPAIADTETVVVLRSMPYTQPTVYPEGGAFPAREHERALDRLTMLIQQVVKLIDGTGISTGGALSDVTTFANAAARAAASPRRVGQIGIQLDNDSLWYGGSAAAGDWVRLALRKWAWSREVWGYSENLSAGTRYAGHIHLAGELKAIRFSHNFFEADRRATVNVKLNGVDLLSSDLLITAESVAVSTGFSSTEISAGDRIDVEVVGVEAGALYDLPPQGLQIEIELHES